MKITIITVNGRKNLTSESLVENNIPHQVYEHSGTGSVPEQPYDFLNLNPVGAFRCWDAHVSVWSEIRENTLICEDDASPALPESWGIALKAEELLEWYPIVSLHARKFGCNKSEQWNGGPKLCKIGKPHCPGVVPGYRGSQQGYSGPWSIGSLIYWITPEIAQRLANTPYDGLPVDLLLCSQPEFIAVFSPELFWHDSTEMSLVEHAK